MRKLGLSRELRGASDCFPVSLELRFSYRSGNIIYIGTGRTKNLTDTTVCIETDQDVCSGTDVELRITWPARLQSVCPLELVVRGPLVKQSGGVSILHMESYEFQTCGEHSFDQASSCGVTCNLAA